MLAASSPWASGGLWAVTVGRSFTLTLRPAQDKAQTLSLNGEGWDMGGRSRAALAPVSGSGL